MRRIADLVLLSLSGLLVCPAVLLKALPKAEEVCGMYLAPSTVPGAGRGIIAGRSFLNGELIEITMTIMFQIELMNEYSQLNNYCYTFDEHHSMMLYGAGSLYNHNKRYTTKHHWVVSNDNIVQPKDVLWMPYSGGNDVWFRATENMEAGEEMYSYYGEDWFAQRNLIEIDSVPKELSEESVNKSLITMDDLNRYGHCLTHVGLGTSNIVFAGKGLFAKKYYKAGDIVIISPVAALSRGVIDKTIDSSVLMNYCFTLPGNVTDVTLFPLNNAVAINHQPEGSANLVMDWYDWSSISKKGSYFENITENSLNLTSKLKMSVEELFTAPFAQFDIVFRALRDIQDGEELSINYGSSWGEAWNQYVENLKSWEVQSRSTTVDIEGEEVPDVNTDSMPRFRSYIEVSSQGMFPSHWLRKGKTYDNISNNDL